ncbi:class I SAM-dependent methyltransferase [Hymenobacter busanensis]|uniref:Class I SAM-dependent methyltransferase n=1 Tax=Hymenobacter busanensis TaxID=2607656 RepID=A0A7L5A2G1_9BACT|nr:class I SAM-dependent methyltransferase [Hymenobacter busanensis]KAA9333361.1 class I SAM-dependent methyltransferase [Hymenobacter busanensis]QHJ07960.1 methyltransferase domain-containing protein [Hymenobacter busanensis]
MKTNDVHHIYDSSYAEAYDNRFLLLPHTKINVDFELNLMRAQLGPDSRWLDIGCGTGYFLSQFPGVARAGFDLSPAMLERAAATSPDALFFRQGDFRQVVPEWHSAWSLVSCMWAAYAYVESVKEVEQVVANMVEWTRPGGAIFIPVLDLEDLRNTTVTYYEDDDLFNGSLLITGSSWTWTERDTGKTHENLVSPQVGHFVHLLAPHFDSITVVRYPETKPGWSPRKAVLATGRRAVANAVEPAHVTWPAPLPRAAGGLPSAASLSHQELLAEVGNRLRPGRLLRALQRRLFA